MCSDFSLRIPTNAAKKGCCAVSSAEFYSKALTEPSCQPQGFRGEPSPLPALKELLVPLGEPDRQGDRSNR